jgi:hypothetical protein
MLNGLEIISLDSVMTIRFAIACMLFSFTANKFLFSLLKGKILSAVVWNSLDA